MDFRDERARGIYRAQSALLGVGSHGGRDAVGGEDQGSSIRHLIGLFHEDGATLDQRGDYVRVVNDLLSHIDRRTVQFERLFHSTHRTVDPGARATGSGQ